MSYEPFEKEWLHAVSECDRLGKQRDQLREALEDLEEASRQVMAGEMEVSSLDVDRRKARAALKATED